MSVQATPSPRTDADAQGRRLESWKEVAAYLGRDVTTVQRWEKREGLPVRRLQHTRLGSVYAYTGELDAWRYERAAVVENGAAGTNQAPQTVRRIWPAMTVSVLGLVLAGAIAWVWHLRSTEMAARASSRIRSIAVLPLQNLSGNPEQDYLADGMTEALIGRLSTIQGLRVISRTSRCASAAERRGSGHRAPDRDRIGVAKQWTRRRARGGTGSLRELSERP